MGLRSVEVLQMSETRFTPGPWQSKRALMPADGEYDYGISAVVDGSKRCIAETFGRASANVRPNAEANAALIAAAPDLYTALERIVASVARGQSGDVCQTFDFDDARAALAKARGES